jgi:hypothetical protein
MKLFKNITLTVIVILGIGLFSIEMYSERGFNCYLESNFGIETDCDGYNPSNNGTDVTDVSYKYTDYDKCRTNMDCWKEVIDDLVNTAVNDASDGIIDKDYYRPRKNIWDAAGKLIDENMKYEISRYSVNKLDSIPYKLKQSIMDNFGLVFN